MTEHGIWTTKADFWVHFFPLECLIYWYAVSDCRSYIFANEVKITGGRSKDGTITGQGYLINRSFPWINKREVPSEYVKDIDWTPENISDREAGTLGQERVRKMIGEIIILDDLMFYISGRCQKRNANEQEELEGWDIKVRWTVDLKFEAKTERVFSDNLFVQKGESQHKVHQTRNPDGSISERFTSFNLKRE